MNLNRVALLATAFLLTAGSLCVGQPAPPASQPEDAEAAQTMADVKAAYAKLQIYECNAYNVANEEGGHNGSLWLNGFHVAIDRQRGLLAAGTMEGPYYLVCDKEHLQVECDDLENQVLRLPAPRPLRFSALRQVVDAVQKHTVVQLPYLPCDACLLLDGNLDALFPGSQVLGIKANDPYYAKLMSAAAETGRGGMREEHPASEPAEEKPQPPALLVRLKSRDAVVDLVFDRATHLLRFAMIHVDATWLGGPPGHPLVIAYAVVAHQPEKIKENAFQLPHPKAKVVFSVEEYGKLLDQLKSHR